MKRFAVPAVPRALDRVGQDATLTTRACAPDVKGKHAKGQNANNENGGSGRARQVPQTPYVLMERGSAPLRDWCVPLLPKAYLKTKKWCITDQPTTFEDLKHEEAGWSLPRLG